MTTPEKRDSAPGLPEFLFLCVGPRCTEGGSDRVKEKWTEILQQEGLLNRCRIIPVNCFSECATGPNACVLSGGRLVSNVDPEVAESTLRTLLAETGLSED